VVTMLLRSRADWFTRIADETWFASLFPFWSQLVRPRGSLISLLLALVSLSFSSWRVKTRDAFCICVNTRIYMSQEETIYIDATDICHGFLFQLLCSCYWFLTSGMEMWRMGQLIGFNHCSFRPKLLVVLIF
jgi:hypothetical protein